jgi:hypothetical protein
MAKSRPAVQVGLDDTMPATPRSDHTFLLKDLDLIRHALAGEAPQTIATTTLLDWLKSEDPTIRRNARDGLVTQGVGCIKPMMELLRDNPSEYRIKSGAIYVLSDLLKRNLDSRAAISSALLDSDFPILVSAASDDDKTIRFQAANFLYDLQDPRAIPATVDATHHIKDPDKATNQYLILRESGKSLPGPTQLDIRQDLTKGPGPANDRIRIDRCKNGSLGWLC